MNVKKLKLLLVAFMVLVSSSALAQMTLVDKGRGVGRIVKTTSSDVDASAATLLQDFVERITDVKLPIVAGESLKKAPAKGDILVGNGLWNEAFVSDKLKEDGFGLFTHEGRIHIVSGGDKGSIYGVVTLLERYFGVQYWGENEYSLTKTKTLTLPQIQTIENPAFRYRQSQFYGMATDPIYKDWMRLEQPSELFAGGYWVHTFDKLLPSARYGKEHPEFYSYFNGKRHPGKASQWCLSNPELFEIVCQQVDSVFRANPDCNMIAVSQNDGNYTHCQCDACRKVDEYEGALSGSVIHFLNKLAARFPDKEFITLAYLYTMKPPKHVRPAQNVNIMLCDIDCYREVTLTENPSGREFVEAMEGWSAITDNIFVWDYGINFDNMVAPFPNFHILAENIRLFRKNHASMHFSQIAGSRGGDFAEMRTWLVSKLMWNPDEDMDTLIHTFLNGYYGAAAPYIYQYIKIMEGALIGSGQRLWIYDSPVSHKYGMLKPELMRRYAALWDRAEDAVRDDSVLLARVERSRLPLLYSELEIARTNQEKDFDDLNRKLDYFEQQVVRFGVRTLNERNNSPVDYCRLFRERYMPRKEQNLARGAKVIFETEPTSQRYQELGKTALTDGLFGGQTYQDSWVGWEGIDASFVVDLGAEKQVSSIETDFLHQIGAWILFPRGVRYSISMDGEHFTEVGNYELPEERSGTVLFKGITHRFAEKTPVRYIRVEVTGTKICPHWHYGVGHPCWFFIDEVTVL